MKLSLKHLSQPLRAQATQHASAQRSGLRPNRRAVLGGAATTLATLGATPLLSPRLSLGRTRGSRDFLLSIFLRGGMDGLTACVPYSDAELYVRRPTLAVPPPGQADGALDLDGDFGLAPACAPLLTPWANGHLAVVHATGSTDPSRSHFDAQKFMELATPNRSATTITTGWLGRTLALSTPIGSGALRAISLGGILPRTLVGGPATLPVPAPANFAFPGNAGTAPGRRTAIADMYAQSDEPMRGAAASSLAAIDLLDLIDFENYVPSYGANYENLAFASSLRDLAAVIKQGIGLESAHIDFQGWDHHSAMGPLDGVLANMLGELSRGLEAFYLDMTDQMDSLVVVVMSEFGRRIAENGSAGTDHGHGNCMFVMGGGIAGGQVLRNWPGLANTGNGDLTITIDYRDILAEILSVRLGATDLMLDEIFPNHVRTTYGITA